MKLVFTETPHFVKILTGDKPLGVSLKIFDVPLLKWNIENINKICKVETIDIPENLSEIKSYVKETFPSIEINTVSKNFSHLSESPVILDNSQIPEMDKILICNNSVLYQTKNRTSTVIESIKYPWDYLKCIKNILENQITKTKISQTAKVPKTTVIDGPCIIEDGVIIDDFCKIKGPIFIGKNSFIGMGSLIRNCVFGEKTSIGFNCEISRSYFSGFSEIAHHNVILDSVIGSNVWFGGYSGTANVLLTKKNVKYEINDELVDTGTTHFGSVVGNNSSVGAAVIILPGRKIPPNSVIQAGTIFGKK